MGTDPVRHNLPPFAEMRADAFDMYNHLPYVKDIYLCTKEMIRPVTGNVIKYFTIRNEEPAVIDTNVLAQQLVEQEARRLRRSRAGIPQTDPAVPEAPADPAVAEQAAVQPDGETVGPSAGAAAEKPSASKAPAGKQTKSSDKNAFAGFGEEDEDDFSFLRKK